LAVNESAAVVSEDGAGAIQCIEITAKSKLALSDVSVELFWDGDAEPSLSCPLHLLCGVSRKFESI
jgi:hypothetical protein